MEGRPFTVAWSSTENRMVHIGIDQAEHLRSRCRSLDLICPFANCPSPALTTRANYTTAFGTFVRDGFRHLAAPTPDHQPESLEHVQGKLLVADWLTRAGWTDVELERHDSQSGRTPDVTAIQGNRRLAVEVQYSDLPTELWLERNRDLRASGFEVIWLWGHTRREVSKEAGTIAIGPLQRAVIGATGRLHVIDPEFGTIATAVRAWTDVRFRGDYLRSWPQDRDGEASLVDLPINRSRVHEGRIWAPELADVERSNRYLHALVKSCLAEAIRQMVRSEKFGQHRNRGPARTTAVRSQPPDNRPRRDPPIRPTIPATTPVRFSADDQIAALRAIGLGDVVAAQLKTDDLIYRPSENWHAEVLHRILNRSAGKSVQVKDIIEYVESGYPHDPNFCPAVHAFLRVAAATGAIRISDGKAIVLRSVKRTSPPY